MKKRNWGKEEWRKIKKEGKEEKEEKGKGGERRTKKGGE